MTEPAWTLARDVVTLNFACPRSRYLDCGTGAVALGSPEASAGLGGGAGAGLRDGPGGMGSFDTRNVIDMLKCKKYIECSHGYGVLFAMHHWRIWLKYVFRIYKELHTEKSDENRGGGGVGSRRPSGRAISVPGSAQGLIKRPGSEDDLTLTGGADGDINNFMSVDGISLKKSEGSTFSDANVVA